MAPRNANWPDIAREIEAFSRLTNATLFAGAGVSARAGIPTWGQYLETLAAAAERHEPEIATLMRARIKSSRFADAATLFKQCMMPDSDKYRALVAPFMKFEADRIKPLMSIPFAAVVTTNFDRVLHDAWASLGHPDESERPMPELIELGEPTLTRAPYNTNFYIARIHGRVEVPVDIVIAKEGL